MLVEISPVVLSMMCSCTVLLYCQLQLKSNDRDHFMLNNHFNFFVGVNGQGKNIPVVFM